MHEKQDGKHPNAQHPNAQHPNARHPNTQHPNAGCLARSALERDGQGIGTVGFACGAGTLGRDAWQRRLAETLPYLPICSVPEYAMVQNGWSGLVNRPGDGVDNRWTWMGIHRTKADSGQTSASKDQSGKTPASKDQSGKTPAAGDRSGKTPAAGDRSGETPASKDQSGKTLVLGVPSVLNTLNPLLADSKNEWRVLQLLCSPLFDLDPVTLQEVPILAKSWDLSGWTDSDGTEFMKVTFHLRAGVFWQDGAPFAAQDVKYTIDLLRKSQDANFEDIISRIDDVIAPDKETVEIYLKDKGYRCLYELAWLTFLPEHIWKNVTDTVNCKPWLETNPLKENLTGLVGQGPFRLEKSGIVDGNLQNGLTLVWDPAYDQSVVAKAIRDRK